MSGRHGSKKIGLDPGSSRKLKIWQSSTDAPVKLASLSKASRILLNGDSGVMTDAEKFLRLYDAELHLCGSVQRLSQT